MLNWNSHTIRTDEDLNDMVNLFSSQRHIITASAFDTETTGLSPVLDRPFLFQFGWYCEEYHTGFTFAVDIEQQEELSRRTITIWNYLRSHSPIDLGHNVKYDLHMQENINLPYRNKNISDTRIWIRLGSDAVPERKGGPPLGLKKFATRYITSDASFHEKELKEEQAMITRKHNDNLQRKLNAAGKPPKDWGYNSWTKGCLKNFFDDKVKEATDLPPEFIEPYKEWHASLPEYLQQKVTGYVDKDMIRYTELDRETIIKYGHMDIILTLETYRKMLPIVTIRENLDAIRYEEANIYPVLDMERVGLTVDVAYLEECKVNTKEYILQRRQDLEQMAGRPLKCNQAVTIMAILKERYGIEVSSTNADELNILVSNLKREGNGEAAIDFIECIQELRTLEKWYSTYIVRFLYELKFSNKIYTAINLTGTVSGRVTSDFQQFPNSRITTITGDELFCPRKMIVVGDDYKAMVYLDYSQIELRLQAMYTILVGSPDLNLCRAYMPYECYRIEDTNKIEFDYRNPEHIKTVYNYTWYYNEEPEHHWIPTDVHGATTKEAFGITEDDPEYKKLRSVGKTVNFAKNYGAKRDLIATLFPQYDDKTIDRIDGAYYSAFPGIKEYHNYCYSMASINPFMINLFGVKYYGASGHNLINMLIQGSGAYFLKKKIVEVSEYLTKNNCKSKLLMQIHDELQFYWHKDDDPQIFYDIKKIMERWDDTLVPIVADVEITTTNWNDKYEVERLEDLYET